jgi:methionine biosynthesis protein MetW
MTEHRTPSPAESTSSRPLRPDLQVVADMIEPGSRVLDLACGEGELLSYLSQEKQVDGRGMELSQDGVNACVARGLSVIQGDADLDLIDYPNDAFDYVILSQSLQVLRFPRQVLIEMLRIGRKAVVSFPNFGHWRIRWQLLSNGRMPVTRTLSQAWYDTPNIHFCTILDFVDLCHDLGVSIERGITVDHSGRISGVARYSRLANLWGEQGVFLLGRRPQPTDGKD